MAIIVNLDVMLAKRKMRLTELSEKVGVTMANLSILKTGKARAVRFSTLDAICKALNCQPGDILEYRDEEECASRAFGLCSAPRCCSRWGARRCGRFCAKRSCDESAGRVARRFMP